jgi:pimeloyl-ACP methyl ester carboxylesterase
MAAALLVMIVAAAVGAEEVTEQVESGYLNVPGGRLFYEKAGQGEPIVLLHDGLLHREVWDGQFKVWAADHTVVRYDRRGFGRSDAPTEPYSNVDDLAAIFEHFKIDSAIVMGMSAGGRLATDFTLQHPHRVTHLVLVGAVVSGMSYSQHFWNRGGHLTPEIRADPDRYRNYWTDVDPYDIWEGSIEARQRARVLLAANPHNLGGDKDRLAIPPERPAINYLSEIKVPTLIVVGEYDIPDVHAHAGAIEAGIAGSSRIVISNSGHLVPLEQPEQFMQVVGTFMMEARFFQTLAADGVDAAVALYESGRRRDPERMLFTEGRLNGVGYQYLFAGDAQTAAKLFALMVDAYPNSSNAHDSYGEALAASGDTARAIQHYEKSLELNPDNTNAVRQIEVLKGADESN